METTSFKLHVAILDFCEVTEAAPVNTFMCGISKNRCASTRTCLTVKKTGTRDFEEFFGKKNKKFVAYFHFEDMDNDVLDALEDLGCVYI